MSDVLVARIAAGEVVERPAAAVKELVENALDAGAHEVRVETVEGGKRLIRVTDDGEGIRAEEVERAFVHHATSKLIDIDDLQRIHTLGFRGEALASIAAVAQVTCLTRHVDERSGTLLRIDNGRILVHEPQGRPVGTTMTVEHLFGRVPARLKFLKSDAAERSLVDGMVMRYALAYPGARFTVVHDGRVSLQTSGSGNLRDVLVDAFGAPVAAQMAPIGAAEAPPDGVSVVDGEQLGVAFDDGAAEWDARTGTRVGGYAALPGTDHGNRSKIMLFVNGRPVQDTRLTYAVVQAYHTLLMVGRYPIAVVHIDVPPDQVDVNVHPAKTEVRFRDGDGVFSAVHRAVRAALLAHMTPPEPPSVFQRAAAGEFAASPEPTPSEPPRSSPGAAPSDDAVRGIDEPRQPQLAGAETWERIGISRQGSDRPAFRVPEPAARASGSLPALRILGQLAASYIIAEGPEGLYLIDQHASHERILYEKLLAQHDRGEMTSQALLDPLPVEVPIDGAALLEERLPWLRGLGFEVDGFGGNTFLVRAVPQMMQQDDIAAALREIVAELESGAAPMRAEIERRILRRVCKRMSIKAGRVLSYPEMQALVRDLEACESPRTCPHGRPTMVQIGVAQLEREFGRT
jgi:DNA mismatch repair protein MutL